MFSVVMRGIRSKNILLKIHVGQDWTELRKHHFVQADYCLEWDVKIICAPSYLQQLIECLAKSTLNKTLESKSRRKAGEIGWREVFRITMKI